MSGIQDTAKPVAVETNNLLFDSFVFEERKHRGSLELCRKNVYGKSATPLADILL